MSYPVPGKPRVEEVRAMFDRIAPTYDRLNRVMSLGIDRWWRRVTVCGVAECCPRRVLDVATGTGDLAILAARRIPDVEVVGVDLSERMIGIAREKVAHAELRGKIPVGSVVVRAGDAMYLPFADGSFDAVTVAFGVRNFADIPAGLREINRVVAPGGSVFVLEFSPPRGKIWSRPYRFYTHRVLPRVGARISRDGGAYRYLPDSIGTFPDPERFRGMLREAGFRDARTRVLTFGVACLHKAVK